ncbi:MAG: metallophosphoesterase [Ruminococcus sp.]|nr:metallophosphoesterase [Ruminococcus sp.]
MRIIVISDSHGNFQNLEKVIMKNTDAQWIFHLGDGELELDRFVIAHPILAPKIIHVAGNCDYDSLSPEIFTLPAIEHKIFAAHGHKYGVAGSLDRIKKAALENGCDIILYGHTHERFMTYEDGLWIMNPGSIAIPRDGQNPSFGNIDISEYGVLMNIADV